MIVHRNLKGSTLQVGVRGINCEAPTTTPSDLQDIQKDRRDRDTKRKHTDGARGSGAGALITRPARKPSVSKVIRPVEWDISLAGVLPVLLARTYIRPMCARHTGAVPARKLRGITRYGCFCFVG